MGGWGFKYNSGLGVPESYTGTFILGTSTTIKSTPGLGYRNDRNIFPLNLFMCPCIHLSVYFYPLTPLWRWTVFTGRVVVRSTPLHTLSIEGVSGIFLVWDDYGIESGDDKF